MTTLQKITSIAAGASLLAGVVFVIPSQAATSYIPGREFLQGHTTTGGAVFLKDFMGYYASDDAVRLFNDETIRHIFKNDTGAGGGYIYSRVVVNPSNSNVVYFTTKDRRVAEGISRWRMNAYDFSSKKLTILSTKDFNLGEAFEGYHLIGSEGTKLVLREDSDNSPAPCANAWTALKYFKMDIQMPSAGVTSYTVPKEQVDQGEAEAKTCRENTGE